MTNKQIIIVGNLKKQTDKIYRNMLDLNSPARKFMDIITDVVEEPLYSDKPELVNAKNYIEKVYKATQVFIYKIIPNIVGLEYSLSFKNCDTISVSNFANYVVKVSSTFNSKLKDDYKKITASVKKSIKKEETM